MRCADCKWATKPKSPTEFAECRRMPPVRAGMVNAYTYDHMGVWPLVHPLDYCGEFSEKPKA